MIKRLTVYLEDAPLGPKTAGRGLQRVNSALLSGLDPYLDSVLLLQTHARFEPRLWDERFPIRNVGRMRQRLAGLARRFSGYLPSMLERPAIAAGARLISDKAPKALFAPIGVDIRTASRAAALASRSNHSLYLYFVDDIAAASKAMGAGEARVHAIESELRAVIAQAHGVFTITEALRNRLPLPADKPWQTLPLPFEIPDAMPGGEQRNGDVTHIGAINHIYVEALVGVAQAIGRANRNGATLRLRLTSQPDSATRARLEAEAPLVIEAFPNSASLQAALSAATCAVVPAQAEESGMYATSFPSKLMEYLNACRAIIIYGAPEAAAFDYFTRNDLPYVASQGEDLTAILAQLANDPADLSPRYRSALQTNNAATVIGRNIVDAIGRWGHV